MNVAPLLTLFLLSLCCPVAHGMNLYPSCQGGELQGSADAGGETTLFTLPQKTRALKLTCLAYELSSLMGGMKKDAKDPCSVAHQTEYLHRLVIRAATQDRASGKVNSVDFDVKDLAGGSLGDVVIRLPGPSRVSLVFMNNAVNRHCSLRIRAIMSYTEKTEPTQQERLPVAVSVVPRTVYVKRSAMTSVFLRYPPGTNMHAAQSDVVKLVELSKECATGGDDGHIMRLPSSLPPMDHRGDPATLGLRDYYFDTPETYRVCYYGNGTLTGAELAVIRVFDGNPSHYQVVSGQDEEGRVLVGVKTTVKFYGYDLDTRPGGDKAKFVSDTEECATAKAAGGVSEATNLGPGDSYGPSTTYALWTWVLRKGGAFKVCYKRRDGVWTEVPSITDVGQDAAPAPTPGTTDPKRVPRPTDPVTKAECPMASVNAESPWVSYKSLKFTLNSTKLPKDFLKTLSQWFCIPRAALAVTHMTHDSDGRQVMYLSILCEDLGEAASCDTVERQNYILSLGKQQLTLLVGLGIASVEGSRHLFAFGDDVTVVKTYGGHLVAVLMTCLTVVVVVAMAVYGVLKYRENRQYFIQFGADDADVEDMYATDGPDNLGPPRRRVVKDAVIEVEE